jgi:hypothetical protein
LSVPLLMAVENGGITLLLAQADVIDSIAHVDARKHNTDGPNICVPRVN